MAQIFICILLLLTCPGTFCKYVYIRKLFSWYEAQSYCRVHYTDLAPVITEHDIQKLQELYGNTYYRIYPYVWIGLERNSSEEKWMWSGGGEVSRFFWAPGQPDGYVNENRGFVQKNVWYDTKTQTGAYAFCYKAVVVKERKTWEEALEYCREQHNDLASMASETELLLIQKEMNNHNTTEHVWIGLHFFSGDWQWMDGQEMVYQAWGQDGTLFCPHAKMECAALQVKTWRKSVWGAHDCEERLNFVCY